MCALNMPPQWAKSDAPLTRKSFFTCSCIREVWLLVLYVTDSCAFASNTQVRVPLCGVPVLH